MSSTAERAKTLIVALALLQTPAAEARNRTETCSSYTSITGTTTTECRRPERKPTHCESYTNINGTTKTECR